MAIAAKGNMVFLVDNHGKVLAEKELDGQVRDVDEVFDIMEDTYEEIQEKGQLYWDGILDEYEALCDKCIELRTIIGSGGILPDNSISSLLEQSAQLKGALSDAFGHMSENQLDRFGTIQEKYTYLTR